ncbi:MAG: SIS domain-containing protein [Ardenticatenaceae bacterium]|nr:SIS domain-containing protein [Anaerolineales bacterium]MCB8975474.1 SIS domain-containing protein [Ardenticatenaceae bacterium]
MMTTTTENPMVAQVKSLPELIRSQFKTIDRQVRQLMSHEDSLSVKRIVIVGCGDSHMAGIATELAFEKFARIPTEPKRANTGGRYAAPYPQSHFPRNPLVIGISVSGTVTRTREAVGLFKQQGLPTIAITGNPESPLAQMSDMVIDCTIPAFPDAPGVRNYRMSLLALYLLAIRFGEVKDLYSQDEANKLRQSLLSTADSLEATIAAIDGKTQELAEAVKNEKSHVFVGDGPNFATAMFGAAKVIESAGVHAMAQESEEWAHLQYFTAVENRTPTFLISPGYRGHERVGKLMIPLQNLGRQTIAIVPEGDTVVGPHADWVLPVVGEVAEPFTPMVYAAATELFAAYMAEAMGATYFRRNDPSYIKNQDIRNTEIVTDIEA